MQRDDKVSISEMLWWGLIGTIVAGAVLLCGAAFGQTTPPNVLIVVLDDVRTDDVEQVPQVGEIAARGTSFTRAMATFALCTPSRASTSTKRLAPTSGRPWPSCLNVCRCASASRCRW